MFVFEFSLLPHKPKSIGRVLPRSLCSCHAHQGTSHPSGEVALPLPMYISWDLNPCHPSPAVPQATPPSLPATAQATSTPPSPTPHPAPSPALTSCGGAGHVHLIVALVDQA